MMCKIMNINKWIKENPEEAERQATLFAQSNSKRMVNALKAEDETALHQGTASMYTALCDKPAPTMKSINVPNNWEAAAVEFTTSLTGALQPFNLVPGLIDTSLVQAKPNPTQEKESPKIVMQTMATNLQPLQEDIKQTVQFTNQADRGANFAATDRIDLLHDYKLCLKPIAIVAFFSQDDESNTSPQEHTAIGEGILKLVTHPA
jgi:hypothetical protein